MRGGLGLVVVVAVACAAPGAAAMVARMTAEQRAATSPLIVTGVLIEIRRDAEWPDWRIGVVAVDRVLKGDPATETVLLRLPAPEAPRSGEEIDFSTGTSGLWFLRSLGPHAPGLYAADHPQRFVPESRMAPEVQALTDLHCRDAEAD